MSAPTSIQKTIQELAPSAIIELFELSLTKEVNNVDADETYYYHAGTNELKTDIIFNGKTYAAIPVEIEGFDKSTKGTLPRPTFKVANANGVISSLISTLNNDGKKISMLNAQVKRITTCKKFLDGANFSGGNATADSSAIFEEDDIWYIDRVSGENAQYVEFELTMKLNLTNLRLPRRQILETCPWKYRGAECGYKGKKYFDINDASVTEASLDVCGHRYSSCTKRFKTNNEKKVPFGGFPGARLQM